MHLPLGNNYTESPSIRSQSTMSLLRQSSSYHGHFAVTSFLI